MSSFDYRTPLENAKKAYADLNRRRTEVLEAFDRELSALKKMVEILESYAEEKAAAPNWSGYGGLISLGVLSAGDIEPSEIGLTQRVRAVLRSAEADGLNELSATEVRDRLRDSGFDLARYENPLAAIHEVLRRVASRVVTPAGKRYRLAPRKIKERREK
jgi:hypothetical protein